jgi:hypothetical protein
MINDVEAENKSACGARPCIISSIAISESASPRGGERKGKTVDKRAYTRTPCISSFRVEDSFCRDSWLPFYDMITNHCHIRRNRQRSAFRETLLQGATITVVDTLTR